MCEIEKWQPDAPINNLLKRAAIISKIRLFFSDRGVLEVETPSMSLKPTTDVYLVPFQTYLTYPGSKFEKKLWLVTSPEFHMKRLLAAGSGAIYQIGRCFRNEEQGNYHNPEFTMLEWYRPYYDMYRLMAEVDDLLQQVLECEDAESLSYQQVFINYLGIDPLSASKVQLRAAMKELGEGSLGNIEEDRDTLLMLLFMLGIEPKLGASSPTFIYHFPASQAALAEISVEDHRVSERFEVYYKGLELANGFRELTDSREQKQRFERDNQRRLARGLPKHPIDTNLLNALSHGIPDCSGVALGIDRLIMLALQAESIKEVIAFTTERS